MTNKERLTKAGILKEDVELSAEQQQAIEELTEEEIEILLSARNKTPDKFPAETLIAPIAHHH